ncbi:replication protein [Desulfovermiculus halophilus]|uniref:replication protein n=1 Tax=Desulfovermiculus halophilus TaxID=339722 RepID=UPI000A0055D7|nr:replication protein [Desulfovermiculus halophilus]
MASPQCENGYTRLANELLEALARTRLAGQEYQAVLAIVRKTYGFGKKSDKISYGQLSKCAVAIKIRTKSGPAGNTFKPRRFHV